jgi:hypothetical protein
MTRAVLAPRSLYQVALFLLKSLDVVLRTWRHDSDLKLRHMNCDVVVARGPKQSTPTNLCGGTLRRFDLDPKYVSAIGYLRQAISNQPTTQIMTTRLLFSCKIRFYGRATELLPI